MSAAMRGIWKVHSMVTYLSNRLTNSFIIGIILNSYLSSMLEHNFQEDVIMQVRKILLLIHNTVCILEKTKFQWNR